MRELDNIQLSGVELLALLRGDEAGHSWSPVAPVDEARGVGNHLVGGGGGGAREWDRERAREEEVSAGIKRL